jgi:tetratricopeptide (TPR) repeat protein
VLILREAQILAVMGHLSKSVRQLKILLQIEPFNDEAYLTLASVYSQLQEHHEAINNYQLALKYSEEGFRDDVYIDLALEYENVNSYKKAIAVLKKALKENPDNETAIYEMAHCFEQNKQIDEAISYYNAFIDSHPYSYSAWYNLGNLYLRNEDFKKAISAYEYSLVIEDNNTAAWYNIAHAHIQIDEYEKAIECFEETFRIEEPQSAVYCYIGECYEKLGELDTALDYYHRSMDKNDQFVDAYIGKAVVLDLQGEPDESLRFLKIAHKLDAENEEVLLMLAETYRKLDRTEEAEELYTRLTSEYGWLIDSWLDYADFHFELKDLKRAYQVIEYGLGENPHNGSLLFRKIAYLHALGKKKEALLLLDYLFESDYREKHELIEYYPAILKEQEALELYNSEKA